MNRSGPEGAKALRRQLPFKVSIEPVRVTGMGENPRSPQFAWHCGATYCHHSKLVSVIGSTVPFEAPHFNQIGVYRSFCNLRKVS